jgi:hypothetical protein
MKVIIGSIHGRKNYIVTATHDLKAKQIFREIIHGKLRAVMIAQVC